jgi:hypothetical protein
MGFANVDCIVLMKARSAKNQSQRQIVLVMSARAVGLGFHLIESFSSHYTEQ